MKSAVSVLPNICMKSLDFTQPTEFWFHLANWVLFHSANWSGHALATEFCCHSFSSALLLLFPVISKLFACWNQCSAFGVHDNWLRTKWRWLAAKRDHKNILLSPEPSCPNPHFVTKPLWWNRWFAVSLFAVSWLGSCICASYTNHDKQECCESNFTDRHYNFASLFKLCLTVMPKKKKKKTIQSVWMLQNVKILVPGSTSQKVWKLSTKAWSKCELLLFFGFQRTWISNKRSQSTEIYCEALRSSF